ncbi:hypothetical protein JOQ06_026748, partial [Pogonophryne albipinna]
FYDHPLESTFRRLPKCVADLNLLSKDVHSMQRMLLSVFTQSLAYVASDLSVPGGDHRTRCPVSQLSVGRGSVARPRELPVLHFPPEAAELSQETLEG